MSLPLLDDIVYGPVRSRRLGVSLGVNLLPAGRKICNMDCAYCQYGWTRGAVRYRGEGHGWPPVALVEAAVAARLTIAADENESIDRLTLAGHGEPTLHPEFEEIVVRLGAVRDRIAPRMPIAIFSNSTTVAAPDIRRGLSGLDERYMKLDAGDAITFADLNGGGRHLSDIIDGLRSLPPITIQAMFVSDSERRVENSGEMAVDHWLRALETIQPKCVHVYTIDRAPALTSLRPVTPWRLREIAEHVRAIGIPAHVFEPT
jgi:wyosine [tRNA(Phe)-imidazoG37] synthetase (radical SAM superfamily)